MDLTSVLVLHREESFPGEQAGKAASFVHASHCTNANENKLLTDNHLSSSFRWLCEVQVKNYYISVRYSIGFTLNCLNSLRSSDYR